MLAAYSHGSTQGGSTALPWQQQLKTVLGTGKAPPPGPIQSISFSPNIPPFERPFRPMQVLPSQPVGSQLDGYSMTMQKNRVEILPGKQTEVWTYNGQLPGPLIRQTKNHGSVVRFINQLGKDEQGQDIHSTIHLHGVASLPQYDGYAEDLIPPQHYKDYYYPNDKAASFWYHDHVIEHTARNVYMGLAGMYIVDYDDEDFVDPTVKDQLPQAEYDIPLIIQDKRITPDGELVFNDRGRSGVYGDVVLVNGVPSPRLEVKNRRYRFRVLNGGVSRTLNLAARVKHGDGSLEPIHLQVIASDSGLLSEPISTPSLRIGVAERYEFVLDFADYAGKEILLVNPVFFGNLDGNLRTTELMCFQVAGGAQDNPPLPKKLGILTPIETLLSEVKGPVRTFRFDRLGGVSLINGKAWDPNRVDAFVEPCATERWRFISTGGWVHPIHVHLGHFRLIGRSRTPIAAYERGMKDTFFVNDWETVEMIGRFGPHEGKYMMHCHNLVHEDHDMMTQFQVGTRGCPPCAEPAKPLPAPANFDLPQCVPPKECMA
ncbi:MAG: multicopper oxidase family protein [Phormidesmis sp. RL_2_1]|nr:multicopper oxidase family protein [Phormidesmis sp. RL_2_1]